MKIARITSLLLGLALALPGPARAGATPDPTRLEASFWHLAKATDGHGRRIHALFLPGRPPLRLHFAQGYMRMSNLCNASSGRYRLQGDQLIIEDGIQTTMGCREALLDQESRAHAAIASRTTLTLADDRTLHMRNASGDVLVFTPEPTPETRYGSPGEVLYLDVAPRTGPCPPPAPKDTRCLQVRQVQDDDYGIPPGAQGAYAPFQGAIEGFSHQPGMRSVLRVKRFRIPGSRADGAAWAYVSQGAIRTEAVEE